MMSHIVAYQPPEGQGRLAPISLFFLLIPATWNEMNIYIRTQPQQPVDNGATQQFLPPTARRLTEDDLRHLVLAGDIDQRPGDIAALRADDLGPQVFSE